MGIIQNLQGKIIFVDTAPLIYYIEGHSLWQSKLIEIFTNNHEGQLPIITSTLTLLELLVQPLKLKRFDLVEKYEQILTSSPHIDIIELNIEIAKKAAEFRSSFNLKTPDSIQIATAVINNAEVFLTNDKDLQRVNNDIKVITLADIT
jgi:predicted nucleic acid-binding protein